MTTTTGDINGTNVTAAPVQDFNGLDKHAGMQGAYESTIRGGWSASDKDGNVDFLGC